MTKSRRKLPKYVVEYEVPKGSGKWFVYFRRKGQRDVRMHGTPYSPEWMETYHSLLAGETIATPPKPVQVVEEKTFAWLCQRYMASSQFGQLDALTTQPVRRQILQSCIDEPLKADVPNGKKIGAIPLHRFTPKVVATLRDRKKDTPEAANGRIKAVRQVFKWACLPEVGEALANPARDVQYLKPKKRGGFHTWTPEEVEQYERRHPIGTKARLALALIFYTFQRRSDVHRFGRQHERENGTKLVFTQFKGRNKEHPVHMELPILPDLRAIIDATPTGDMVYLLNDLGRPFTAAGFGNKMRQWCDQAGLPQCSAHGLRKEACVRMAYNGATVHEIQAWSGHKTLKEVERYTKEAEQRKLAGMAASKAAGRAG